MANQNRDEKELRKREEKSAEEKQWDEKYRRDPLGALVWPLILIWAGVVFLAANMGLLDRLIGAAGVFSTSAWSLVLFGAGIIVLVEVGVRLLVPEYRRPITGSLILAIILIGLGLGELTNWAIIWPLILIILGLSILLRGFIPRR
jgi:LiaF transmembrane domain